MYKRQVLSGFSEKEAEIIRKEIDIASKSIETLIEENIDKSMNLYNSVRLMEDIDE